MKKLFFFILCTSFTGTLLARMSESKYRAIDILDCPTAEIVDQYGYSTSFRFYQNGSLQNKNTFGVVPHLNLGFGLDAEEFIGTGDTRLNTPTLNVKFRFFDGKGIIPAFAMGYDGQGFVYDKGIDEYEQKQPGFYLVSTMEIFIPDSMLTLGVNRYDFSKGNTTRGFMGWSYTYENLIGPFVEWDHATVAKEHRLNFGLKYFVTPAFTIDVAGRNIPKDLTYTERITERVVRLTYTGSF